MNRSNIARLRRWMLLLVVLLVPVAVAIWMAPQIRYERAASAIVQRGESLDRLAYVTTPGVPSASVAITEALGVLGAVATPQPQDSKSTTELFEGVVKGEPLAVEIAKQHLEEPAVVAALDRLDSAWGIEKAGFSLPQWAELPVTEGPRPFNDVVQLLRLGRLVALRGALGLHAEPAEGLPAAWQTFRFARWIQDENPYLVGALVAMAVANQGLDLLEAAGLALKQSSYRPESIDRSDALTELDRFRERPISWSYRVERTISARPALLPLDGSPQTVWDQRAELWFVADVLRELTTLIEIADLPPFQRNEDPGLRDWNGAIAQMLIPNFLDALSKDDRLRARVALVHARYDTAPEPRPIDPFLGAPLQSSQADGGCFLYSVGANGVDDRGGSDDIVWRIPCEAQASALEPTESP